MKTIQYKKEIQAPATKVYHTMLGLDNIKTYEKWTAAFDPTSTYWWVEDLVVDTLRKEKVFGDEQIIPTRHLTGRDRGSLGAVFKGPISCGYAKYPGHIKPATGLPYWICEYKWAYDYYASFDVEAEDKAESIEQSILDKIGEKSINWEYMDAYKASSNRITYEEVIDGTRPVQTEKVLGVEVAVGV